MLDLGLQVGAGNPGGPGASSGTGGLLIICVSTFSNQGTISSNGFDGGNGSKVGGGGSGGGSIIFYKENISSSTSSIRAHCGSGGAGIAAGGRRRTW